MSLNSSKDSRWAGRLKRFAIQPVAPGDLRLIGSCSNQIWIALFNALCQCLLDPELPVRAQAAVSLFFLVGLDEGQDHVFARVPRAPTGDSITNLDGGDSTSPCWTER